MNKKKCCHCGYKFKPTNESEEICELCKVQLRDDSSGHRVEFDVKYLSSLEIKGKMLLFSEKIVFEPKEVYFKDRKMENVPELKFVIKENDNLLEESKEIKKELIKQIEKTIEN